MAFAGIERARPGGHILKFSMTERAARILSLADFIENSELRCDSGAADHHFPSGQVSRAVLRGSCSPCLLASEPFSGFYFSRVSRLFDVNASLLTATIKKVSPLSLSLAQCYTSRFTDMPALSVFIHSLQINLFVTMRIYAHFRH